MGSFLSWLLTLQILTPVLKPGIRLVVGLVAIPLFRLFVRRMVSDEKLDAELTKDLEQWFRGSLLLLVATANMEAYLFGQFKLDPEIQWIPLVMRLLLAIGVIEAMPDQALFAVIYPGPPKFLLPKTKRMKAIREHTWPFLRGMICRHIDRSSSVFAIIAVIKPGPVGWVCYGIAITQFLIIGLVCSKEKALDVLRKFDQQMELRRQELAEEIRQEGTPAGADLRTV